MHRRLITCLGKADAHHFLSFGLTAGQLYMFILSALFQKRFTFQY